MGRGKLAGTKCCFWRRTTGKCRREGKRFGLEHRDGKKETVLVTEESVWQFSSPK